MYKEKNNNYAHCMCREAVHTKVYGVVFFFIHR